MAQARTFSIEDPATLQALAHPTRVELLEALREPASAASAARKIGLPRQRVNHHFKALKAAGLINKVGRRQQGNFVETLYQAKAQSFVVAPDVTWADPRRLDALREQHALNMLVHAGKQLQQDAIGLLDQAAFEEKEIPSATLTAQIRFSDATERAAFFEEYATMLKNLVDKYATKKGEPYRLVSAIHPQPTNPSEAS